LRLPVYVSRMINLPFILRRGLIYIPITIQHKGRDLALQNCIFDTGAAGTTFDVDQVASIGLTFVPESKIKRLATIGGYQRVFTRVVDSLRIGEESLTACEIEIGDLNSQFKIDAIIGTDVICRFNWQLDFAQHILTAHPHPFAIT